MHILYSATSNGLPLHPPHRSCAIPRRRKTSSAMFFPGDVVAAPPGHFDEGVPPPSFHVAGGRIARVKRGGATAAASAQVQGTVTQEDVLESAPPSRPRPEANPQTLPRSTLRNKQHPAPFFGACFSKQKLSRRNKMRDPSNLVYVTIEFLGRGRRHHRHSPRAREDPECSMPAAPLRST